MNVRHYRVLVFFAVLLLATGYTNAAFSAGSRCRLSGHVTDAKTGEGLPFASLLLRSTTDSTITKGAISAMDGTYSITDIPYGNYKLTAAFMGYENQSFEITIDKRTVNFDIGLSRKSYTMSEVEIQAEKQVVEQGIEKTTVNVSRNTALSGGNALDVMQTLPSVDFDVNGNISYRGSSRVTLLLNGKQSGLVKSLEQIPAGQIEKIEIINNPSAKYDANGTSGIINIVLKSGNKTKSKTSLNLYAGLPETYGGNVGYSDLKGKSSFFVNGGYNYKTRFQTKEHLRKNYEASNVPDYYQYDRQDEKLNDLIVNSGMDYSIGKKQQVGLSLVGSRTFNSAIRKINYKTLQGDDTIYNSIKDINIALENYSLDGDLNYQLAFSKKGQKLDANLHMTYLDQLHEMDNVFYPVSDEANRELQNTDSKQLNRVAVFSLDYADPLKDSVKLESGYRYTRKDLRNDFNSESFDAGSGLWVDDTALSNQFHYLLNIHAVYVNLVTRFSQFDLQVGLRAEYTTDYQLEKRTSEYVDFFPSITVSRKLSAPFESYISYNRRINRPTIKMLNPYTNEYADVLNQHIGNPDLKPEYVNSIEVGTRYASGNFSGLFSVYFRNIDQAISRVKSATNDSALTVTFMNLDKAHLYGSEISVSWKVTEWWHVNTSANIFYTELSGIYGPNVINRSHTGWTGSMMNKIKLPLGVGLQLNGYYKSKLPDVMGTYKERYYLDMALDRKILSNKGKVIFKISDLFNTYRYGLDLAGVDENGFEYSQRNRRKNESQYFILSFIYNISGKPKQMKKGNYFLEDFGK